MKITGHKTEAVYSRYAIAPRASLSATLRKLAEHEEKAGLKGGRARRRGEHKTSTP